MSADPMLAKAAALEDELVRAARLTDAGIWNSEVANTMLRAALLIQQMRVRLESLQRDGVD